MIPYPFLIWELLERIANSLLHGILSQLIQALLWTFILLHLKSINNLLCLALCIGYTDHASSWANFHVSLERAKKILNQNQNPETFFEPIINKTLENIITQKEKEEVSEEELEKHKLFLYYRGKASEHFAKDLKKAHAPCRTIFKLRKLKTMLPSLKPPVEKKLKSHLAVSYTHLTLPTICSV